MATVVGTTDRCCVNLQQALDNMSDYAPNKERLQIGILEGLRSEANANTGIQIRQAVSQLDEFGLPDGVGDCKMEILFELPDCAATVASEIDICGSIASIGDTRGYLEQTITQYRGRSGTWTLNEFDCICERPDERLAKQLINFHRSISEDMEQDAATAIAGFLSNYHTGVDSADVAGGGTNVLNILNTDHVNAVEWAKLRAEYRKQYAKTMPILAGGDILAQYNDVRLAGLGANAIGADPAQLHSTGNKFVSYELDAAMHTALGSPARPPNTSYAVSWIPGSIQLLEYMQNKGAKEWFWEKSTRTTLNIQGVTYDWYMMFEECDEPHWKFKLEKRFDFFHIPEAVYLPCFPSSGVLLWLLGCGDASCINIV